MKNIILITIFLFPVYLLSQNNIDKGKYLSSNKLQYICIGENHTFSYLAYKDYSPHTLDKGNKSKVCGTIGYILDVEGKGVYEVVNDSLFLKFRVDVSNIHTKTLSYKLIKGLRFKISELNKIED